MLGLVIPLVGFGAVALASGRLGVHHLPAEVLGLPVPMLIFGAIVIGCLAALRSL
jgi:hypothetical protein